MPNTRVKKSGSFDFLLNTFIQISFDICMVSNNTGQLY